MTIYESSESNQTSSSKVKDAPSSGKPSMPAREDQHMPDLKPLIEAISYGVQVNDLQGKITYSNRAHHLICGYPEGEIIGKNIWDLLASEEEKQSLKEYLSYLVKEQPKPSPYVTVNQKPDGSRVNIQVDWSYIYDNEGSLAGFVSLISDVSERIKLENEYHFYIEILQNLAEGVCLFRADDGRVIYTNPKFDAMFGYDAGEIIGQSISTVNAITAKSEKDTSEEIFNSLSRYGVWSGEVLNTKKNGEKFWSNTTISSFEHQDYGSVWIAVHEDISDRKQAEEILRRSEKKYRDLFENSRDAILIIENDKFVECNQATLDMLGYTNKKEFLQQHPSKLSPPKQPDGRDSEEKANEMMQIALREGSNRFEWDHVRANGEVFPVEVLLTPLVTETGAQVIHTVWRDITKQKQQRNRILHQAHYDSLTDLPNRFLSLDRLDQMLKEAHRRGTKVAVFFLDLDNFKKVNDILGHDWGDKILMEAAQRLSSEIREGDTVGRLGGDEFIVLLGDLNTAADASSVAVSLLEHFRKPFVIEGRKLMLTASIGIACYPDDADNTSDLLRLADTAMYHSKEQGRNTYHYFTEEMNQGVARRLAIEEQLQTALANNEFSVCYQPIVRIADHKMIGVEALLRWQNKKLGQVGPDEFIPISEQSGHIVAIGDFVLNTATHQLAKWQRQFDSGFKVAINISPRQFRDVGFIERVKEILQRNQVAGHSVELEITEGVLMSGHASIDEALARLNEMDVDLSMDDFGTGYSSLSYLRKYPFDTLKIDRSFVRDVTANKSDSQLVIATIALAHGLGLKVVAEGVETRDQLEFLKTHGCDFAQGYLFSKPLSAEHIGKIRPLENH